jgi:hypothetical protein
MALLGGLRSGESELEISKKKRAPIMRHASLGFMVMSSRHHNESTVSLHA